MTNLKPSWVDNSRSAKTIGKRHFKAPSRLQEGPGRGLPPSGRGSPQPTQLAGRASALQARDPKLPAPPPPNPGLRGASDAEETGAQSPGAPRKATLKEKKSWRRKRKRAEQSRRPQPAGHRARGPLAGPGPGTLSPPPPNPPNPRARPRRPGRQRRLDPAPRAREAPRQRT